MHEPSEQALKIVNALEAINATGLEPRDRYTAHDLAMALHDPALGLDRSVCLRDVVNDLKASEWPEAADFVASRFAPGEG